MKQAVFLIWCGYVFIVNYTLFVLCGKNTIDPFLIDAVSGGLGVVASLFFVRYILKSIKTD